MLLTVMVGASARLPGRALANTTCWLAGCWAAWARLLVRDALAAAMWDACDQASGAEVCAGFRWRALLRRQAP